MVAANPHLAQPVTHAGAPLDHARTVAIVLHGRGQSPATMRDDIVARLGLPGVAYVMPAAVDGSWYPMGFMAPRGDNEPRLSFALDRVTQLSDDLARAGVPLAAQILIGFSQGACLACEYVYQRHARLAGLIAFTGGLIGSPGTTWRNQRGPLAGMPTLFTGSLQDPWVPAERICESIGVFERLGARVETRLHDGDRHEIRDAEIAAARGVLVELGA